MSLSYIQFLLIIHTVNDQIKHKTLYSECKASLETPTEAEVGESEDNSENLEQSVWVASRGLSLNLVQIIRDY